MINNKCEYLLVLLSRIYRLKNIFFSQVLLSPLYLHFAYYCFKKKIYIAIAGEPKSHNNN